MHRKTESPRERVKGRRRAQEAIQLNPQARTSDGIAEHIIDLPVPQILEQSVKVVKGSTERVQQHTGEPDVDAEDRGRPDCEEPVAPVLQFQEETVGVPMLDLAGFSATTVKEILETNQGPSPRSDF